MKKAARMCARAPICHATHWIIVIINNLACLLSKLTRFYYPPFELFSFLFCGFWHLLLRRTVHLMKMRGCWCGTMDVHERLINLSRKPNLWSIGLHTCKNICTCTINVLLHCTGLKLNSFKIWVIKLTRGNWSRFFLVKMFVGRWKCSCISYANETISRQVLRSFRSASIFLVMKNSNTAVLFNSNEEANAFYTVFGFFTLLTKT